MTFNVAALEVLSNGGKFVSGEAAHPGLNAALKLVWKSDAWVVTEMSLQP